MMIARWLVPAALMVAVTFGAAADDTPDPLPQGPIAPKKVGTAKATERQFLEMKVLWTYMVRLPPDYLTAKDKKYPICVILHGSGSTETGHGGLADSAGRDGVIYVCPRAPYPHLGVIAQRKQAGWSAWWPRASAKKGDPQNFIHRIVKQYSDWVFACVDDARKKYRTSGTKVSILGHSQGAAFANICAVLRPARVESVFSYAGYLPEPLAKPAAVGRLKTHGVKVVLAHGTADKVVKPDASKRAAALMKTAGVDHTLKLFDGAEHSFNKAVLDYLKEWGDTQLRGKTEEKKKKGG